MWKQAVLEHLLFFGVQSMILQFFSYTHLVFFSPEFTVQIRSDRESQGRGESSGQSV